jgi:hypothetical protein
MREFTYNVEWIGDYYNAATTVIIPTDDADAAIAAAERQMLAQYGWDMGRTATISVNAELVNVVTSRA